MQNFFCWAKRSFATHEKKKKQQQQQQYFIKNYLTSMVL
jgi:hypothetical protein